MKRPYETIARLAALEPEHPLAVLGPERLATALDTFVALTQEIGLPYGGAAVPGDNLLLPSPLGAIGPTLPGSPGSTRWRPHSLRAHAHYWFQGAA